MAATYYDSRDKRQTDWLLVLLYLLLVSAGFSAIYSAKFSSDIPSIISNLDAFIKTSPGRQFIWVGISLITAFVIQLIDRKTLVNLAPFFYGVVMLLLIYVIFSGYTVGGGSSWIKLGPFRLQPSEFAKFSTALMVAWYLSSLRADIRTWTGKIITGIIIFVPFALIVLQNDMGTALVFTSFIFVLYREGLSNWYMVILAAAIALAILTLLLSSYWIILLAISIIALVIAILNFSPSWKESVVVLVVSIALFVGYFYLPTTIYIAGLMSCFLVCIIAYLWYRKSFFVLAMMMFLTTAYTQGVGFGYNILKPHQKNRIDIFLGKMTDRQGVGYNLHQSMMAIGSGGETGKGYLNGNLTKGKFVPEQSTDFIFCTVGEEFGFLGTASIVLLYLFIMVRIIYIAERQPTKFTRIYAYSVASIIFIHFWINIGMTIGLMPVIGIPLPAMSYGGSSLLGFTLLIAILLRLDADRGNYTR